MGVLTKTSIIVTCDICHEGCNEEDGRIEIQVNGGDGRDVGPATINGYLTFTQPYQVSCGIICKDCKKKYLRKYLETL